jgi:cytochrome c oxidase cbb3-type subunit III
VGYGKAMRIRRGSLVKVTGIVVVSLCCAAVCQVSKVEGSLPQVANGEGKNLFESSCAVCHGLDGGGGEHAPNIGRASSAKSQPDATLARIVRDGIPGKGMPSFNKFSDLELQSVLSYLRFLQGKSEARSDVGNPAQGKQLFFGKAGCADCHAMHGDGHFLSTDLSDYADDHDAGEIRAAIVNPQEQEREPHSLARVMTNSGRVLVGIIRNENNSSLQIQGADGQFYLLMKSELQSVERSPAPSMPVDYAQKLGVAEIDDLVSYIVHRAGSRTRVSQPVNHNNGGY